MLDLAPWGQYALDWLNLLLRWAHVIVAIAWIGSSFYFVWLDNTLTPPQDPKLKEQGVGGELWAIHGGGFFARRVFLLAVTDVGAVLRQHFPRDPDDRNELRDQVNLA